MTLQLEKRNGIQTLLLLEIVILLKFILMQLLLEIKFTVLYFMIKPKNILDIKTDKQWQSRKIVIILI